MNCFGDRIDNHFYLLKNKKHPCKMFQDDYDKYGKDSFVIDIIEEIDINIFDTNYFYEKEIYYIKLYDTVNNGYNISTGGKNGYSGVHRPENLVKLLGEINKERMTGTHLSEETKFKISKSNLGKIMSKDSKEKISKSNTGKVRSMECRLHLSKVANKKLTDEEALNIKKLLKETESVKKISEITGVSVSIINDIKRGRTYKLVD